MNGTVIPEGTAVVRVGQASSKPTPEIPVSRSSRAGRSVNGERVGADDHELSARLEQCGQHLDEVAVH